MAQNPSSCRWDANTTKKERWLQYTTPQASIIHCFCHTTTDEVLRWLVETRSRDIRLKHGYVTFTIIKCLTRNVGQCPTWWSPCQTQVAPSVQRRKVWLMLTTWLPCSNAAKTWKPLKVAGVPQTPETISAASRPKFTILWRHVEEVLLLNKFFFRLSIYALIAKI